MMLTNETLSGTLRERHLFSQGRFCLIVSETRHCKTIQTLYVNDLCDCYPLTQWMLLDRFCGCKKCEPFPSSGLRFRVGGWGTPLNDAGWSDWLVWSCTCWRSCSKTPQSFDHIRIQSELWAVVWVTGNIIIQKNGWKIHGNMEDDHQRQLWRVHEGYRYYSSYHLIIYQAIIIIVILKISPFCYMQKDKFEKKNCQCILRALFIFCWWARCLVIRFLFQVSDSLLVRWGTGPNPTWCCVWMIRGSYAWSRRAPSKLLRSNLNWTSHSRRPPQMIERLWFVME